MNRVRLKVFIVALFASMGLLSFSFWIFGKEPLPQQQALAFSHEFHLKIPGATLACTDCHRPTGPGEVTLARPDHNSCNTCHQQWFDASLPKKEFCATCHDNVGQNQMPTLRKFPNYNKGEAILFDFSHRLHLHRKQKVTQVVGGRLDCKTCHDFEPGGEKATFPGHKECATCHSQPDIKPRLAEDSKNQDCLSCHTSREQNNPNYRKVRRFIVDVGDARSGRDLKFSHAKHLTDDRNVGITCDTCHAGIDQKTSIADLNIPSMWECTMCHESRRTGDAYRISNCSVCHTQISAGRKPRSHSLTEKPLDHTAAFRTRHAEAARAPDAKCAFCHEFVSDPRMTTEGIIRTEERYVLSGGNCAECHAVMRPKSHTVRWRSDLHGRMAAISRNNCAVCHESDFCIRCHNIRPRSHNPINTFVNGGHRTRAQLNQRSCFTCHNFSTDCERCHSTVLR